VTKTRPRKQALWRYVRVYYWVNRHYFPRLSRRGALLDALKMTKKIRRHR
jgi:hypothetical protein